MHAFKFIKSLRAFKVHFRCYNSSHLLSAKFNVNAIVCPGRNFEKHIQALDDEFVEHTLLRSTFEKIRDDEIDPQFKSSFWPKLIGIAVEYDKNKILDSLILFVLESPNNHSTVTLVAILKVLACRRRFDEFESLYWLIKSRLSTSERVACAADLVVALAETPLYTEALSLLPLILERSSGVGIFERVFTGAAMYGSPEDTLHLFDKLMPLGIQLETPFYRTFIGRLGLTEESTSIMINLLQKIKDHGQRLCSSSALIFKDWFEGRGWQGTMGVSFLGLRCPSCGTYLNKLNFTEEQCTRLSQQFYVAVIKGVSTDELYLTTTPEELDTFHTFLDRQERPFDCIVDLPNYLHNVTSRKLKSTTSKEQTVHLCNLVFALHRAYNVSRFCLVGKQRGTLGRKAFWDPIKKLGNETGVSVQTFFTDHKSNDDAFMIYLALWSGPKCYLFSKDEYRQHRFTMGPELSENLSQWQAARQIHLRGTQPIKFSGPVECDPCIQGNMETGWHIPYDSDNRRLSYHPPNTWLCLRRPPKTTER